MPAYRIFCLLYLMSGAAALVYEVAWLRLLTQHFGQTEAAVSTVLASFMGGLGLGAALFGRFADRVPANRALHAYAALEGVVAVSALLVPVALDGFAPWLATTYANGDGGLFFAAVRLVLTMAVLTIPTTAIGATFPAAVRWLEYQSGGTFASTGWIYGLNTLGAATGALLTGFVWLPAFGLSTTVAFGVTLNVLAGLGAVALAKWQPTDRSPTDAPGAGKPGRSPAVPAAVTTAPRFWLGAVAVLSSGLVSLVFEVVWTRLLALSLGPTVYAFSAMLVAFIVGIAIGALAATKWSAVPARPVALGLGAAIITSGAACLLAATFVPQLPLIVGRMAASPSASFPGILAREVALVTAFLLPMSIGLGAAFPFGLAAATGDRPTKADRVAALYAFNTAGAILGALAGGFVLVPLLGLRWSLLGASSLALVMGVIVVSLANEAAFRARMVWLSVAIGAALVGVMLPEFDPRLLSSGAYKYASYVDTPDLQLGLEAGSLLYYEEGLAGTVSVRRSAGTTSLAINGKVDASNGADMLTQKLLAHVPLLLHPMPRDVCIIGLGSGVTLGSALRHPITRADMLEISPEVAEAASYFAAENHGALSDPRTNLVLGDGRTHLLLSSRDYDVIVSEPSNPWMAGIANLFTREMFAAAKRRLKPGGVFCQWAHTYDISDADLRSIVATFGSVFPDGALWLVGEGDVLLVGSTEPIAPKLQTMVEQWDRPGLSADLADVDIRDAFSLVSQWLGGSTLLKTYGEGARPQTDDRLSLEFTAPRAIFGRQRDDTLGPLRQLATLDSRPPALEALVASAGADELRHRGEMFLRADAFASAYRDFTAAFERAPTSQEVVKGLARAAESMHKQEDVIGLLRTRLAQDPGNVAVGVELARLLTATGRAGDAVEIASDLAGRFPTDSRPLEQLASIFADGGDTARLEPVVAALTTVAADAPETAYFQASLAFMKGAFPEAVAAGERVLIKRPNDARTLNLLGAAFATGGDRERARQYFQASLKSDPKDATSYTNLATFELEAANADTAANLFSEALTLDPSSETARRGLIQALRNLGRTDRAAQLERVLTR
ncbi:MAG: fused MFS/spermidine synthase [Vicinamibacterales bacterium]